MRELNFNLRTLVNLKRSAIDDAAAAWLGRRDGGLDAAQEAELALWLRTDSRCAEAFARMDAMSRALDRLAVYRPAGNSDPVADLPLKRLQRRFTWFFPFLAAAAAIAIAYVSWWRTAPETVLFSRTAVTEVGGLQKITLPDGSIVELNTDSAVNIRFTHNERRVALVYGEAHFAVAKNPARPFIVEARGVAVRAVGTAFDVRLRPESVEVLVTEGKVRVNDARRGTPLIVPTDRRPISPTEQPGVAAGQCAVISFASDEDIPEPAVADPVVAGQISQKLAWEDRRLDFDPTPLGVLVAEFNRYNSRKLIVADPAIAGLRVGGSFLVNNYDAFVRLLESSFDVTADRSQNEIILRGRHSLNAHTQKKSIAE